MAPKTDGAEMMALLRPFAVEETLMVYVSFVLRPRCSSEGVATSTDT